MLTTRGEGVFPEARQARPTARATMPTIFVNNWSRWFPKITTYLCPNCLTFNDHIRHYNIEACFRGSATPAYKGTVLSASTILVPIYLARLIVGLVAHCEYCTKKSQCLTQYLRAMLVCDNTLSVRRSISPPHSPIRSKRLKLSSKGISSQFSDPKRQCRISRKTPKTMHSSRQRYNCPWLKEPKTGSNKYPIDRVTW